MSNQITINKLYDYLQDLNLGKNIDSVQLDEYNLNVLFAQRLIANNNNGEICITTLGEISLLGGLDNFVSFFQQIYLQLNLEAALNRKFSELERLIKKMS